jgi:hypothetical protein
MAVGAGEAATATGEITSQDLLERYRGLVALGRVKWDDEQVRTIMKVCWNHDSLWLFIQTI